MPAVTFTVDSSRIEAHLDKIGPDVEQALLKALRPLASSLADEARSAAASHIRFLGKKPGQYLASIYGDVFAHEGQLGRIVGGFVRSSSPLAHLLEGGAFRFGLGEIFPTVADVLAFNGPAGMVFAKHVQQPASYMPPYPAIKPLIGSHESEIEDTMKRAVEDATKWP